MENKKPHKTSKHLKNNEAILKMLDGTHASQTKKTSGWTAKSQEKREVGERWTDSSGVVWEQRDGFRINGADRFDRMSELQEYLKGATTCPNCNESMTKRNDKKYYNIHKMCMECSITKETKMRYDGTWEAFQRTKVLENVKAWLTDAEAEKEVVKREIGKTSYVNGDGTLEKWELPYDVKEQQDRLDKGFIEFKKNLLTKYGATEKELEEFGVVIGEQDEQRKN